MQKTSKHEEVKFYAKKAVFRPKYDRAAKKIFAIQKVVKNNEFTWVLDKTCQNGYEMVSKNGLGG